MFLVLKKEGNQDIELEKHARRTGSLRLARLLRNRVSSISEDLRLKFKLKFNLEFNLQFDV